MGVTRDVRWAAWLVILIIMLVDVTGARGAVGTLADSSGEVVGWGLNTDGQISIPEGAFTAIAAGGFHSLGIKSDGALATWGGNDFGQATVPGGTFTTIAAGYLHNLGIKTDGMLAGWGFNGIGQATVPSGTFTAVAAGGNHGLGIRSDGTLVDWGDNSYGQLNDTPSGTFMAIATGFEHSLGIRSNGTLAGWGLNGVGQATVPGGTFTAVAAGFYHSLGIKSDGTLAGWGRNDVGQATVPAGTFTAVAAGGDHSLGIRSDGTLVDWGDNFYGQLNDTPSGTFTAVAAGRAHNLALRARTNYDGDLLITGSGMTANLNRSVDVAGDFFVESTVVFYNNPTATVSGKAVFEPFTLSTGSGTIIANGIEIRGNPNFFSQGIGINDAGLHLVTTGGLSGTGGLFVNAAGAEFQLGLAAASTWTGGMTIGEDALVSITGTGVQSAGSLRSGDALNTIPSPTITPGGELRMGPGQRLRFTSTGQVTSSVYPAPNYNGGKIELAGSPALGTSDLEFVGGMTNAPATGLITGQSATLRFTGGLANYGSMALSAGLNNVSGDINNHGGGTITVTGGASAIFSDDIVQNGTFRVAKVGSTVGTAVVLGSFSGSGGSTGGGDIFFEGDPRPGNSPTSVTFANNVALGGGASTNLELAGTTLGAQYDHLNVTGELSLGGALSVSLLDGFAPTAGNSFDILDWGVLSGAFSSLSLPALASGLAWNTSQLYTNGVLSVTSVGLPGDFNLNGTVDATDYVMWRNQNGSPSDYNTWRANFGKSAASGSGRAAGIQAAVPEPAALLQIAFLAAFPLTRRRRNLWCLPKLIDV